VNFLYGKLRITYVLLDVTNEFASASNYPMYSIQTKLPFADIWFFRNNMFKEVVPSTWLQDPECFFQYGVDAIDGA